MRVRQAISCYRRGEVHRYAGVMHSSVLLYVDYSVEVVEVVKLRLILRSGFDLMEEYRPTLTSNESLAVAYSRRKEALRCTG